MATAITMPRWGMIMEEGLVVEWLKKEGEKVAADEPLFVVESEKVTNEATSPVAGVVGAIVVPEGETAIVGQLLAVIIEAGENVSAIEEIMAQNVAPTTAVQQPLPTTTDAATESRPSPDMQRSRRKVISPAAKRLAAEEGIDWQTLTGSGPRGRIERKDIQRAIAAKEVTLVQPPSVATQTGGRAVRLSQMRKTIAHNTLQSIQAPQAALCREIDITPLLALRKDLKTDEPHKKAPTYTALVVKAVALALQKVPALNARLDVDSIWLYDNAHIGVVVAVEGGVVVPVIHNANQKRLSEIATELDDLTQRARAGTLRTDELTGGTFTISNAGPLGIDLFQALLYPPQVGALGLGRGRQRAVVVDGEITIRTTAYFCVSSDHRAVDGEPIGRFLDHLEAMAAEPDCLLEMDSTDE